MSGSRVSFLVAAGVALGALGVLHVAFRTDPEQRNYELFTEMTYSRAYEAFSPNPHFADGKTLQDLVPGVVPRGTKAFLYGPGPEEAVRAGEELVNPVAVDDGAALQLGGELYRVYCIVCHDVAGNGQGPVVLRGMLPPPSFHAERAKQIKDGEMFHILTMGQGNMAPYAAQLSPMERWSVIRHVRTLQEAEQ